MESAEYASMDTAEDRMWWYRALHARLLAALDGTQGPVLDAGCGTGGFLARLQAAQPGIALYGIEWAGWSAGRAAQKSGAMIARGSVNALPFAENSFSAAVSADVLCHAAVAPEIALAELHRVLRAGGKLVINLPSYQWMMSAHDRQVHNSRRFTSGRVRGLLLGAGFGEVRLAYWNSLLLPAMVLNRLFKARSGHSDVALVSPWLDALLHGVTRLEHRYLPRPPAGGSILAIASRH